MHTAVRTYAQGFRRNVADVFEYIWLDVCSQAHFFAGRGLRVDVCRDYAVADEVGRLFSASRSSDVLLWPHGVRTFCFGP
jgi:hypothetical protein